MRNNPWSTMTMTTTTMNHPYDCCPPKVSALENLEHARTLWSKSLVQQEQMSLWKRSSNSNNNGHRSTRTNKLHQCPTVLSLVHFRITCASFEFLRQALHEHVQFCPEVLLLRHVDIRCCPTCLQRFLQGLPPQLTTLRLGYTMSLFFDVTPLDLYLPLLSALPNTLLLTTPTAVPALICLELNDFICMVGIWDMN